MGFLTSVPKGMEEAADIIFFIFIIGGVFGISAKNRNNYSISSKTFKSVWE